MQTRIQNRGSNAYSDVTASMNLESAPFIINEVKKVEPVRKMILRFKE